MCYTKFSRVLCASDTCLALTEAEVEMWEHAVQSNPVSERSKAFDPNINFNIYLSREDSHLFRW